MIGWVVFSLFPRRFSLLLCLSFRSILGLKTTGSELCKGPKLRALNTSRDQNYGLWTQQGTKTTGSELSKGPKLLSLNSARTETTGSELIKGPKLRALNSVRDQNYGLWTQQGTNTMDSEVTKKYVGSITAMDLLGLWHGYLTKKYNNKLYSVEWIRELRFSNFSQGLYTVWADFHFVGKSRHFEKDIYILSLSRHHGCDGSE